MLIEKYYLLPVGGCTLEAEAFATLPGGGLGKPSGHISTGKGF
jgi:hypothetical protein